MIYNEKHIGIIISIIWGLVIAILFRKICQNDKLIIVEMPFSNHITSNNRNTCTY